MSGLPDLLTFFSTNIGLIVMGAVAGAIILLWEWRSALAGLFIIQVGVGAVAVQVEKIPAEWAGVMTAVTALACMILALSANQARRPPSLYQSGSMLLRALVLILIFVVWQTLHDSMRIPEIVPQVTSLFVWLALCVLVMLGLSDNPLFYGVALLLWCIPVQAVVGVLLGIPALIALIGMIELVIALACSYLVLVDQLPVTNQQPILTDITFPEHTLRQPLPVSEPPSVGDGLGRLARGWWRGLRRRTPSFRHPGSMRAEQPQGGAVPVRKQP